MCAGQAWNKFLTGVHLTWGQVIQRRQELKWKELKLQRSLMLAELRTQGFSRFPILGGKVRCTGLWPAFSNFPNQSPVCAVSEQAERPWLSGLKEENTIDIFFFSIVTVSPSLGIFQSFLTLAPVTPLSSYLCCRMGAMCHFGRRHHCQFGISSLVK